MFVSMRMPVELVAAVDERAAAEGRSRSAVLRRLAEEEFGWEKQLRGKNNLQVTVKQQPAPEPQRVVKTALPKPEAQEERRSGCPECGSLSGHQKFCSKR
jgi:hypothetical protein